MFFDISFWQGFVGNLLATILGVIVGIPTALWLNRLIEDYTEKEKRTKIFVSLREELKGNLGLISNWQKNGKDSWALTTIGVKLGDEIWSAFSDGGELEWIKEPWVLSNLANAYADIKRIKYLSDKYLNFFNNMDMSTKKVIEEDLVMFVLSAQDTIANALTLVENYSLFKPLQKVIYSLADGRRGRRGRS